MVNTQEWLDQNYPLNGVCQIENEARWVNNKGKKREQITELYIKESLTGELKLTGFSNLTTLYCWSNQLTNLNLSDCSLLTGLYCYRNQLTNLDFLNDLDGEKLTELFISNNNFPVSDLTPFSKFVNLKYLYLDNNNFTGSLEPLKGLVRLERLNVNDTDIDSGLEYLPESVKEFYCSTQERPKAKVKVLYNLFADEQGKVKADSLGRIINLSQKLQDYNNWIKLGFTELEIKSWINTGLTPKEHNFANFLKKERKISPSESKDRLIELQKDYQGYVASKQSEAKINQFIQEAKVERIPHEELSNIEHIADGGFGKIYQAEWKDKNIILKSLNNSSELTPEFLREVASHNLFDDNTKIVKCHGISQDPTTKNYLMVMDYVRGGNLREYLKKNNHKLDFKKKLIQLHSIAEGLKNIHDQGLVHKDFHSGNILSGGAEAFFTDLKCHITDLGLCKPASEKDDDNVYGVLPYVAPEVLRNKGYIPASDIYSFGMVAYEIVSGKPPYHNIKHNEHLGLSVCKGERPSFEIKVPQLLKELIEKCWDAEAKQRPTASELLETLSQWKEEINNPSSEIAQQVKEVEEFNRNLPTEVKFPKYKFHPQNTYTSKLINTKQITNLLNSSQVISEQLYNPTDDLEEYKINLEHRQIGIEPTINYQQNSIIENQPLESQQSLLEENKVLKERIKELEQELQSKDNELKSRDNEIKELKEQNQQLQANIEQPPK